MFTYSTSIYEMLSCQNLMYHEILYVPRKGHTFCLSVYLSTHLSLIYKPDSFWKVTKKLWFLWELYLEI